MNLRRLASRLAILLCLLSTAAAAAAPVPPDTYSDLRWRLVGPLRGGWGTAASGVPGQPETFYFGAADGGVWKTTDAGRTWNPLFDHEKAASVGALVVAPSDPAVLYVGTGQVTTRWDIASGNGVYRSGDGGKTWEHRGLADSRHIGRLWVDPRNADVVLAAAQGHFFGPNAERGVFRSTDGGKSWDKVLFVDDNTGAVDLAADPAVPDTIYAALWQVRYYPWLSYFTPNIGPGSGIYKSTDGGKTWTRLSQGLPAGPMGRVGLAVAPGSRGARVYATIDIRHGLRRLPLGRRRRLLAAGERHGEPRQRLLRERRGRSQESGHGLRRWGSRSAARPTAARPSSSSAARRAATTTTSCGSIPSIRSG